MNKNQNGFTNIVLAVLAILLLAGAGYWYTTHYQKSGQPITNPIQVAPLVTPSPTPTPEATSELMLKINASGGLCQYGTCNSEIIIKENGSYSYILDNSKKNGVIPQSDASALRKLIQEADFVAIKSKKYNAVCPSAYDGQELTYTFYPSGEKIASCSVAIDEASPLFKLIGNLLNKIYAQK